MSDDLPDIELEGVEVYKPWMDYQVGVGDRFTATTADEHTTKHEGPGWSSVERKRVPVRNPVSDNPYWLRVRSGEFNTTYHLEVVGSTKDYLNCEILYDLDSDEDYRDAPDWLEVTRNEPIVWDGTPQNVEVYGDHNDVMSEGDVRGSKNDLLSGHK